MTPFASGQFAVYYRVSTARQGASGLGLDAQRAAVAQYVAAVAGEVVAEFEEVESGKKSDQARPKLARALAECKKTGARLLVAKLDRLARNVHFVSGLMRSKVGFVACDLPEASDLTIHVMASFAEHEAKRIGERTRDALAAAKKRGKILGKTGPANLKRNLEERKATADSFAERMRREVRGMQAEGKTVAAMVSELNQKGITTARGGQWQSVQLGRVIARLDAADLARSGAVRGSW
ncbi:resolvase [Acidovorax sp. GW101-3H11]|uniref:recombinase family protein n=1 Tax=Acidovorax sp. GW101-3H11 TaxID=1813946 RepID=UPI0007B517D6|nr:recombinase family protein [Acidovorax sp. GW101-3H11]KZT13335.1 resolvase [Acidovorax sp. GW101-3H11]